MSLIEWVDNASSNPFKKANMQFKKGELYHIYNRGNNHDRVFYSHENYIFFIKKIKTYVSPYADIVAWCLMPNHFHIMVSVNEVSISSGSLKETRSVKFADPLDEKASGSIGKQRTLNQSIGIMLRSYTNAIQKQENRTGALFQEETKAVLLSDRLKITPAYVNTAFGCRITVLDDTKSYPQICFNYIHQNPVAAKFVTKPEEWAYSSYQDYLGIRNGKLVDREKGMEFFSNGSLEISKGSLKETRSVNFSDPLALRNGDDKDAPFTDPLAEKANGSSGAVHNFENSLIHERDQAARADAFYRDVLKVSEIKRFNSDSEADMAMQRQDVDVLLTLNGINYRVSEKFRDKDYGDLYVEVYSKYPKTRGWLNTGSPNAILYFTPKATYWITHKSLATFCLDVLFPQIPDSWYIELFQSHKTIVSKRMMLMGEPFKINIIQAHNQPSDGHNWETIGISASFSLFEKHGVKIKKF